MAINNINFKANVQTVRRAMKDYSVGESVFLNVGGIATEFLVVHQGSPNPVYDYFYSDCDGTWLLMKDCYTKMTWGDVNNNNIYTNSAIHDYLNSTFFSLLDADVQSAVRQVEIPMYENDNKYRNTRSTRVFLLGGAEVGWGGFTSNEYLQLEGCLLNYFSTGNGFDEADSAKKIANYNGEAVSWWLRSMYVDDTDSAYCVGENGGMSYAPVNSVCGVRPALVLPFDFISSSPTDIINKQQLDNRKRSGRIVIGLEGVHTFDDADMLCKTGSGLHIGRFNISVFQEALSKHVQEVVLLPGTYNCASFGYDAEDSQNICLDNSHLRGSGNSTIISLNYDEEVEYCMTQIKLYKGSEISDMRIETSVLGNNTSSVLIYGFSGGSVKRVTIVGNITVPIYGCDHIAECYIESDYGGIHTGPYGKKSIIENCIIFGGPNKEAIIIEAPDCILENNYIGSTGDEDTIIHVSAPNTVILNNRGSWIMINDIGESEITVGATTVPESKFKQLNEIGKTYTITIGQMEEHVGWWLGAVPTGWYAARFERYKDGDGQGYFTFYWSDDSRDNITITQGTNLRGKTLYIYESHICAGSVLDGYDGSQYSDLTLTRII